MSLLFWQNLKKHTTLELLDKVMIGKNSNGRTMYADVNQLRNLIGAVANGAIVPQIVPSNNLGSPSEMKIYYAPAGTYSVDAPAVGFALTANFNILIWDLEKWTYMQIPIAFAEQRLVQLEDTVGNLSTKEYSKDMSAYNFATGGFDLFTNNVPLLKNAILRKIRVKATSERFLNVKAVSIDGGVATILHDYGNVSTMNENGLQVIYIEDNYLVQAGSFIAISNTAGTGFLFDSSVNEGGFRIASNAVTTTLKSAFDFAVLETENLSNLLFRMFVAENYNFLQNADIQAQKAKNQEQDNRLGGIDQTFVVIQGHEDAQANLNTQNYNRFGNIELAFQLKDAQILALQNANTFQNQLIQELDLRFYANGIETYEHPVSGTAQRGSQNDAYGNRNPVQSSGVLGKVRVTGDTGDYIQVISYIIVEGTGDFEGIEQVFEDFVYEGFTLNSPQQTHDFIDQNHILTEGSVIGIENSNGAFVFAGAGFGFSTTNAIESLEVDMDFEIFTCKSVQSVDLKIERMRRKLPVNNNGGGIGVIPV